MDRNLHVYYNEYCQNRKGKVVFTRGNRPKRMTMISAYQSALSALQAFGTRINSNANNIANSLTDGFKRTGVNLASMQPQGGVKATVAKVNSQGPMVY